MANDFLSFVRNVIPDLSNKTNPMAKGGSKVEVVINLYSGERKLQQM